MEVDGLLHENIPPDFWPSYEDGSDELHQEEVTALSKIRRTFETAKKRVDLKQQAAVAAAALELEENARKEAQQEADAAATRQRQQQEQAQAEAEAQRIEEQEAAETAAAALLAAEREKAEAQARADAEAERLQMLQQEEEETQFRLQRGAVEQEETQHRRSATLEAKAGFQELRAKAQEALQQVSCDMELRRAHLEELAGVEHVESNSRGKVRREAENAAEDLEMNRVMSRKLMGMKHRLSQRLEVENEEDALRTQVEGDADSLLIEMLEEAESEKSSILTALAAAAKAQEEKAAHALAAALLREQHAECQRLERVALEESESSTRQHEDLCGNQRNEFSQLFDIFTSRQQQILRFQQEVTLLLAEQDKDYTESVVGEFDAEWSELDLMRSQDWVATNRRVCCAQVESEDAAFRAETESEVVTLFAEIQTQQAVDFQTMVKVVRQREEEDRARKEVEAAEAQVRAEAEAVEAARIEQEAAETGAALLAAEREKAEAQAKEAEAEAAAETARIHLEKAAQQLASQQREERESVESSESVQRQSVESDPIESEVSEFAALRHAEKVSRCSVRVLLLSLQLSATEDEESLQRVTVEAKAMGFAATLSQQETRQRNALQEQERANKLEERRAQLRQQHFRAVSALVDGETTQRLVVNGEEKRDFGAFAAAVTPSFHAALTAATMRQMEEAEAEARRLEQEEVQIDSTPCALQQEKRAAPPPPSAQQEEDSSDEDEEEEEEEEGGGQEGGDWGAWGSPDKGEAPVAGGSTLSDPTVVEDGLLHGNIPSDFWPDYEEGSDELHEEEVTAFSKIRRLLETAKKRLDRKGAV